MSESHSYINIEFFYKLDEIGNNASIVIRGFTMWKQKNSTNKMLPPVSTEPLDLIPDPPISFLD